MADLSPSPDPITAPAIAAAETAPEAWQRTLWAMVAVQFVMTLSFTVLSPIMPLFLPDLGVHDPRSIDLWAGILNSLTPLVAAFASPLWGRVADRRGRKLMVLRCSLAICFFTALMGLSLNVWQFMGARALMGVFSGFSAAAIALVASQVPERRLGYALGWLSTGQLIGGLCGPMVGGVLADVLASYRYPFFCTSLLAASAGILAWLIVPEKFTPPREGKRKGTLLENFSIVWSSPALLPLFVVLLLAQFGVRTVQPVVTLYVQQLVGNPPGLATLAGIAFSITGLADLVASPFLGKRSDVIGYRRVLLICLGGAALMSAPQAFVGQYWAFVAERFGVGMFVGGILPTANALVGRSVLASQRGLVYGLTASAMFFGSFLGPFAGGAIAASIGLRWVFLVTAALLLGNLVWVYFKVPEAVDREVDVSVAGGG